MKNKLISKLAASLMAISVVTIGISSCGKTSSLATGTVYVHLHTNIDTNEVADNNTRYSDANGRHFSLSKAQFFMSNIVLKNVDGNTYTIKDAYILKGIDGEQYIAGTAPVGTYTSFTFNVGLDPTTNSKTPSSFSPASYLTSSEMWYGNTAQGYMFMKVQGIADTTATQNGTNQVPFNYEIGSAANLKTVSMPVRTGAFRPYTLVSGGVIYLHMICDYGKLLSVVDFKTQSNTDTYNTNPALATTIANNIPNMFEYED